MKLLALLAFFFASSALTGQTVRIGVDPRVELMSIIFKLAGSREYSQGSLPSYEKAIESHFAAFREHEAVRVARELRETDGVSYDAVMSMAVHIKDAESLTERLPFDRQDLKLDKRWEGVKARRFLEAARKFSSESKFGEFMASQSHLFNATNDRLKEFVAKNADLPWFDSFFGRKATARLVVIPGMTNGGSSYGASAIAEDGVEEIFAIPGVWEVDSNGIPVFAGGWTSTMVHEFVHSYANPLIDRFSARLEAPGQKLYEPLRAEMNAQAYGNGLTVLKESLVRASTARYVLEHEGQEAADRAIISEHGRSFLWTRNLVSLLGEYAADRKTYGDMSRFMPRIVAFFETEAGRVGETIERYEEARPKLVSISIADGAQDVEPGERNLVVKFDRPMRKTSFAIARTSMVALPKMGKPSFDETATVMTVSMNLEPGKEYAISLNWPGGGSFQSVEGALLKHVAIRFRTRQ